jgi:alkylation response protein AidB-like acyl-CoA dehydrogenase
MDLDFTEEQEALREMVRRVCVEHVPVEVVRALDHDPIGYPAEFWKQLGELGLLGILIPEAYGGAEMSMLDAAIVYEEFGRALAPSPHFVSGVLSAGALLAAGSDAQKEAWLPKIASGEAILTPAWLEPDHSARAKGVQLTALADGDSLRLNGTKRHVHFASSASRLVVLARSGPGEDDIDLVLVDPNAPGVTLTQQRTLATDTQYRVDFADVVVPAVDRIGAMGSGWSTWRRVMLDGIILAAAQANGGADKALEITCEYAQERQQFGKPLAAFQAISHYLADAATAVSREAPTISCPGRGYSSGAYRRAQTQNRENNPMQSTTGPGSQRPRRLRPGHQMVRRHGPTQSRPAPGVSAQGAAAVVRSELGEGLLRPCGPSRLAAS